MSQMPSDLTLMTADVLSQAIHQKQVSCREVMAATLDRIERVNTHVNAIVSLRDADALLAEADVRDAARMARPYARSVTAALPDGAMLRHENVPWLLWRGALLVVAAVAQEWKTLTTYFAIVGLACLLFNLASMGAGYAAPLALRLPKKQAIAIAMEIGIHNGTLAIFIALNVLQNPTISVPAAVYSLLMFVTAAVFAWWVSRDKDALA